MSSVEKWQERMSLEESSREYRHKDWVRYQVTYVNRNGETRTTEITASSKINAASLVSVLGEVRRVDPVSVNDENR
jgi:hypothetical protein